VCKASLRGLAILAATIFASTALATEPDGRVAFRYEWIAKPDDAGAKPVLRLSLTTFVDLSEAQLRASLPAGFGLTVHSGGRAPSPWREEGLELGVVPAGRTIVIDLDVAKPAEGGGIVGFVLQATAEGRDVREGVGVTVGQPGTAPTLRNGALEFPAAEAVPTP
jgi:hypothetical protein